MNENVQELVSRIKQVLIFNKLFLKNYPEFNELNDPTLGTLQEKIKVDITTDEQLQELISLSETAIDNRDQFLSISPEFISPVTNEVLERSPLVRTEIESAWGNLKSIVSTIKGA